MISLSKRKLNAELKNRNDFSSSCDSFFTLKRVIILNNPENMSESVEGSMSAGT